MDEAERGGMQRLAVKIEAFQYLPVRRAGAAIDRIAEQRMADRSHMDPHLVGPSRFEPAFDKRRLPQRADNSVVRHRPFAALILHDRDLLAVCGGAGERGVDCPGGRNRQARDDRQIAPLDAVRRELRGQPFMGDVGLGDDQQPGRILVDPVHDPRPRHPADAAKPPGAMVEQGVDQRAVEIARRRMDDHPGRLVDDQQMLVLEHDFQRDILRLVMRGPRLRNGDFIGRPASAFTAGSRTAAPFGPSTAPLEISAFSRSRDKVGTAAARARSSRQPALASEIRA